MSYDEGFSIWWTFYAYGGIFLSYYHFIAFPWEMQSIYVDAKVNEQSNKSNVVELTALFLL